VDDFGHTTAGRHGVDRSLEVRAGFDVWVSSGGQGRGTPGAAVEDRDGLGGRSSTVRDWLCLHHEGVSTIRQGIEVKVLRFG